MQRFLVFLIIPLLCFFLQSCGQSQKAQDKSALSSQDPQLNRELGDLFMAKNKLKPGIVNTQTGLQYLVVRPGVGLPPKYNDLVTVYYQGAFINGKVFDAAHLQNAPVTIRISAVIPGWQEALMHMQPGAIWVLYVPPQLAYGDKGVPGVIPPNQTLVYTVNLVGYKS